MRIILVNAHLRMLLLSCSLLTYEPSLFTNKPGLFTDKPCLLTYQPKILADQSRWSPGCFTACWTVQKLLLSTG